MKDHYDFSQGKRGAVIPPAPNKVQISIRLDPDILDWFRAQVQGGGSYQTLINQALRNHMEAGGATVRDDVARAECRAIEAALLKTLQTLSAQGRGGKADAKAWDAISRELTGSGAR